MIQGSKEWFAARAGKITASRFGDVLANPKTKRYQEYLTEIVDDLSGVPHIEDEKPWFKHGKEMEPRARSAYEWECFKKGEDITVVEKGLIIHPKYDFISCSPDGLILPKKGIEIKSRVSHEAHKKSIKSGLPSNHKPQVQGCLWVTGFDSWDYVSYFEDPDGRLEDDIYIEIIEPDLEYHERLEKACLKFWEDVQSKLNKKQDLGW